MSAVSEQVGDTALEGAPVNFQSIPLQQSRWYLLELNELSKIKPRFSTEPLRVNLPQAVHYTTNRLIIKHEIFILSSKEIANRMIDFISVAIK